MKPMPRTGAPKFRSVRNRGFALIVTLSLMILLTIIAVGLLTLSSITLRASGQGDSMQTARANAKMALMLAISQLQEATGPDQRITVLADQRAKADDGKESAAAPTNRQWTGVYRSWPATSTTRPEPEFVSWLVSNPPSADPTTSPLADPKFPDAAVSSATAVTMVGEGTLGSNTAKDVTVPSIRVVQPNKRTAKIAWWIGDQGMKAAISTPEASKNTALGVVRHNLQSAPRNAYEFAMAGTTKPFSALDPADPRIGRLTSWQQAELLASSADAPRPLFHDLSTFSTGLLTNVSAGGFRRDLSLQLERPAASAPTTPLYTINKENGINLSELWAYYNSYKDIRRAGTFNFTTSGRIENKTPYLMVESSPTACSTDDEFFLKQPAVISYQMILSFQAFPEVINGTNVNRVYVVSDPVITLWNPLDIPVVIPQSSFISVKYWQLPYDVVYRINGGPATRAPLAASLGGSTSTTEADQNYMSIQLGTSQAEQIVLKPGEIVKFSQSGPVVKRTAGAGGKNSLIAKKGFNYGGGFAMPLRDLLGKNIDLKPTDQFTYEAYPNNLTAGKTSLSGNSVTGANAHTRHFSLTHHETYIGADRGDASVSLGYGNMCIDFDFGNQRLKPGEVRGTSQAGTKDALAPGSRLYANNFPQVFRPVAGIDTRPLSSAQLIATKSPFLLLSFDAKTEMGSQLQTRGITRFNPKAHHVDFYDLSTEERDRLPYEFKAEPMVSWVNRSLDLSPDGSGFFGGGMTAQDGVNQVTTHSFPREPIVSLAAFQHSFANGFEMHRPTVGYATINSREPMQPQISHAIGNSLAPSVLASDKTEGTLAGGRPLADHSFLANRALWDDWFLSGIAPQNVNTYPATKDQRTVATEFFSGKTKLPTVRYVATTDGSNATGIVTSLFAGTVASDAGIRNLASYIRVDGLFNVNSTSVEAWKATLGSLKGRPIIVRDATGKETIASNLTETPVSNLNNPADLITKSTGSLDVRDSSQWVGRRELTETEIDALAKAIVWEVRKRGPFLSLADFVNRRVGTNKALAKAGAIQSALDSADSNLNSNFMSGTRSVGGAAARFKFPEAESGPMSQGIPGIIKQADILTPIAPILSARSDSFIIRGYGESVDGNGKITARAWCEALVERDRNFVDPANRPEAVIGTVSPLNAKFGRRYQLLSFRWLSSSEV